MKQTIEIKCNCNAKFTVDREKEIPKSVDSLRCNWCPVCGGDDKGPYDEWYSYKRKPKILNKQMRLI